MKRSVVILLAVLLFCGCIKDSVKGSLLRVGDKLPDFELVLDDGTLLSDDMMQGNVSVVMFFNTSCPDCRQTLPHMQRIYDDYLEKGVRFVFVSREESADDVEAYWQKNGYNMPYSAQTDRKIYELFAQEGIPRIYVSDRYGVIRCVFTDSPVPVYEDIASAIDLLIGVQISRLRSK